MGGVHRGLGHRRPPRRGRVRSRPYYPAQLRQPVDERRLRGQQLLARGVEREPARAVDLGERLQPAGAGRPFELERVADDRVGVEIAFERPGADDLPALLAHLAERQQRARRARRGRRRPSPPPARAARTRAPPRRGRPRPSGCSTRRRLCLAQNGPPGCTSSTSSAPSPERRNSRIPALRFATATHLAVSRAAARGAGAGRCRRPSCRRPARRRARPRRRARRGRRSGRAGGRCGSPRRRGRSRR